MSLADNIGAALAMQQQRPWRLYRPNPVASDYAAGPPADGTGREFLPAASSCPLPVQFSAAAMLRDNRETIWISTDCQAHECSNRRDLESGSGSAIMETSFAAGERLPDLVTLDPAYPLWDRFFMVAPLVVIGTREQDGRYDLAPKHMAAPLSWENLFGFVCSPSHATYQNARREEAFTVSFPQATQIVLTSLAAAPRCDGDAKPSLAALPTIPAHVIDGVLLRDATLFFECRLHTIIDGFGANSLIAGRIVAARAAPEAVRSEDADDQELIRNSPLLAYLAPGRFAEIRESSSFPFPEGFTRERP